MVFHFLSIVISWLGLEEWEVSHTVSIEHLSWRLEKEHLVADTPTGRAELLGISLGTGRHETREATPNGAHGKQHWNRTLLASRILRDIFGCSQLQYTTETDNRSDRKSVV